MLLRRRGESLLGAQDKTLLRAILHARVGHASRLPLLTRKRGCSPGSSAFAQLRRDKPIPTKTELSAIDYRLSTLPITGGAPVWDAAAQTVEVSALDSRLGSM